jgi:hypothetical protein
MFATPDPPISWKTTTWDKRNEKDQAGIKMKIKTQTKNDCRKIIICFSAVLISLTGLIWLLLLHLCYIAQKTISSLFFFSIFDNYDDSQESDVIKKKLLNEEISIIIYVKLIKNKINKH